MANTADDERPPIGFLFVRIGEAVDRAFVEALTDLGLRPRHLRLLVLVDRAKRISQRELGEQLGMDPGNLARVLEALEADGLLDRPRSEDDRRQRLVRLTAAGRKLLKRAVRATARIDERALESLPASQRDRYYELTHRIYREI
jgi:DNA-binding MarR family transcriptional regulator